MTPPSHPARALVALAAVMAAMYLCSLTLRFTSDWLNLAFYLAFLLLPFLAFHWARHLRARARLIRALLLPVLALFSLALISFVGCDLRAVASHRELTRELSVIHQDHYVVRLSWDETAGGAVGPHGLSLQQRRTIVPGLYMVKYLDWIEHASQGTLSITGPDTIALDVPASNSNEPAHRVYTLKSWVYF